MSESTRTESSISGSLVDWVQPEKKHLWAASRLGAANIRSRWRAMPGCTEIKMPADSKCVIPERCCRPRTPGPAGRMAPAGH